MVTARENPAEGSTNEGPAQYLVYLCNGDVIEVGPADALHMTEDAVELTLGGEIVARFDRRQVFTCSRGVRISPQLG